RQQAEEIVGDIRPMPGVVAAPGGSTPAEAKPSADKAGDETSAEQAEANASADESSEDDIPAEVVIEEEDTDNDPETPPEEFVTIKVRGYKRKIRLRRKK